MISRMDKSLGYNVAVVRYNSVQQYMQDMEDKFIPWRYDASKLMGNNGHSFKSAKEYIYNPPQKDIDKAKSLIDKIDSDMSRKSVEWKQSVWGLRENPARVEMGHPLAYKRRVPFMSQKPAVDIWLEIVVSGGVSEAELRQRAAGLAALIRKMQDERPAKLHLIVGGNLYNGNHAIGAIDIDMQPTPLPLLLGMISTRESCRALTFRFIWHYGNSKSDIIKWGIKGNINGKERDDAIRKVLNIPDRDILIQGGYLTDAYMFKTDPIKWVNMQLDKQREID